METWAANWNEAREKHGKCWNSQTGAGNDGKQITKINKKSVSHDNVEVRATRPAWGNKSSRTDVREKNHAVRRMAWPWVSQETWLPCTAADCSHSWILHHFLFIRSPPLFFLFLLRLVIRSGFRHGTRLSGHLSVRYGNQISGAPVQLHPARCQDHATESRLKSIFLLIQIRVTMPTNISNCVVTLAECWFSFFFFVSFFFT